MDLMLKGNVYRIVFPSFINKKKKQKKNDEHLEL